MMAILVSGCIQRGPPSAALTAYLATLGVSLGQNGTLRIVTNRAEKNVEAGLAPDGSLRLSAAWLDRWWSPEVAARVAHLLHHRAVGLPEPERVRPCAAWRAVMFAHEVGGLLVEARLLGQLHRPIDARSFGPALASRMAAYARRCPD